MAADAGPMDLGAAAVRRIVGIGASAGSLKALTQFFAHVSPASALTFVVVQHLDPTHATYLVELLQRATAMTVYAAAHNVPVRADCVYVIAPNTELTLADGRLRVRALTARGGSRLLVDRFFVSLARDQGAAAVAVVLSGMGSDGTLGVRAVHAAGGLTAAQDPDSAEFDSMPHNAIQSGQVDLVAKPADLPARILASLASPRVRAPQPESAAHAADPAASSASPPDLPSGAAVPDARKPAGTPLQTITTALLLRRGHDFSLYKTNTLLRRIERRRAVHDIDTLEEYAEFVNTNPQEIDLLFNELLIGVTHFFRDPAMWQELIDVTLPTLLRRSDQRHFRAWVIGCSTGEEAYSLAMAFAEAALAQAEPRSYSLQIFATDINPDAILVARRGQYPATVAEHVPAPRLARYFVHHTGQYRIVPEIRDTILFARHDLLLNAPFTRLDLVMCRNLLIYFDAILQRRVLPLLHYSLRPGGTLVLGSSESIGRHDHLFATIDLKLRHYARLDRPASLSGDLMMESFPPLSNRKENLANMPEPKNPAMATIQGAADHILLQIHSPPAVVVNKSGDVVYISGRTGKYLEPAAGKTNWNFHAMVRENLRAPLTTALGQAIGQNAPVELRGLRVPVPGGTQLIDVTLQLIEGPSALNGMVMIVFRDVGKPARRAAARNAQASPGTDAVQQLMDENRMLREQMRASQNELRSANEELQSTNEELQSTNEELTTSKEEMQSMNEELQTINSEMQTRLDDFALAQSDLKNLLNSAEIAMLFLDQALNVRRFTELAAKIIHLRDIDVGRPLSDLTTTLQYPDLYADALETLRTLKYSEKQVHASDGRWFAVRIMPYRRLDNVIDGAVITFVDITETKALESTLRARNAD